MPTPKYGHDFDHCPTGVHDHDDDISGGARYFYIHDHHYRDGHWYVRLWHPMHDSGRLPLRDELPGVSDCHRDDCTGYHSNRPYGTRPDGC